MITKNASAMNDLIASIAHELIPAGFKRHTRSFSRQNADGLTEIINFQMGAFTSTLHGKFTINLGIFVPEAHDYLGFEELRKPKEINCHLRKRIGGLLPTRTDTWWSIDANESTKNSIVQTIRQHALPYFDKLNTRDKILDGWRDSIPDFGEGPPRLVAASIHAKRGQTDIAKLFLLEQIAATSKGDSFFERRKNHIISMAREMGIDLS